MNDGGLSHVVPDVDSPSTRMYGTGEDERLTGVRGTITDATGRNISYVAVDVTAWSVFGRRKPPWKRNKHQYGR